MTETQQQLAPQLNRLVRRRGGGTDERVLAAIVDHMHLFTQLLDSSTEAERHELAQTSAAFGRYARVRDRLAARLAAQTQRSG